MATLKFYRCGRPSCMTKEKGQFWSETPICPQCKLEANDPKFGHKIIRLTILHLDPPTDFPGIGKSHRACDVTKSIQAPDGPGGVPNPYHAGTGVVSMVNCPACKLTQAYKDAVAMIDDEDGPRQASISERLEVTRVS